MLHDWRLLRIGLLAILTSCALTGAGCGSAGEASEPVRSSQQPIVVTVGTPTVATEANEQTIARPEGDGGEGTTQSPMIVVTTVASGARDPAAATAPQRQPLASKGQ